MWMWRPTSPMTVCRGPVDSISWDRIWCVGMRARGGAGRGGTDERMSPAVDGLRDEEYREGVHGPEWM
jgi:hypothetical protein